MPPRAARRARRVTAGAPLEILGRFIPPPELAALGVSERERFITSRFMRPTTAPLALAARVDAARTALGLNERPAEYRQRSGTQAPAPGLPVAQEALRRAPAPPPRIPPRSEDANLLARIEQAKRALSLQADDDVAARAQQVRRALRGQL